VEVIEVYAIRRDMQNAFLDISLEGPIRLAAEISPRADGDTIRHRRQGRGDQRRHQ
jgi:hypothetical protein